MVSASSDKTNKQTNKQKHGKYHRTIFTTQTVTSISIVWLLRGLYERGIVRSPWLDRVKLILIKSGFDCVWERASFSDVNSPCKHISDSLEHDFRNVGTEKFKIVINVCFTGSSKQLTDKKNTHHFCLMSVFLVL